jgi:hypothetical protein
VKTKVCYTCYSGAFSNLADDERNFEKKCPNKFSFYLSEHINYIKREFDGATKHNKCQKCRVRPQISFVLIESKIFRLFFFTDYIMTGITHLNRLDKFLMPTLEEEKPAIFRSGRKERLFIFTLQFGQDLLNRKWPLVAPLRGYLFLFV